MFLGYLWILAFPLLIVVPVGAYRSLVSEWDDATYELMSITALEAGHIVRGKLSSSLLQSLIYSSVFLPCIGFTYLLGGVSLLSMAVCLLVVVAASVFSTQFGLALATLTRSRGMQVFFSVLFIMALLLQYWMVMTALFVLVFEAGTSFASSALFWHWVTVGLSLLGAYGLVFYQITRARLLFPSENRSTALRLALLLPPALWLGSWVPFLGELTDLDGLIALVTPVFVHWAAVMALIGGERGEISQRIRRRVPRSFFGRMFTVWLLPGPALGYYYVLLSSLGLVLPWMVLLLWQGEGRISARIQETLWFLVFTFWAYLAIYGGVAAWVLRLVRRRVVNSLLLSLAVMLTLVVLFCVVPVFIEVLTATNIPFLQYRLIHLLNPAVTCAAVAQRVRETYTILLLLGGVSLVCVVWNLPAACREMVWLFRGAAAPGRPAGQADAEAEPQHPFQELLPSGTEQPAQAPPSPLAAE